MLFEEPEVSSTNSGEMAHKSKVKIHFSKSNRKNASEFMLKREIKVSNMELVMRKPLLQNTRKPLLPPDTPHGLPTHPTFIKCIQDCNRDFPVLEDSLVTYCRGKLHALRDHEIREKLKGKTLHIFRSCYLNVDRKEQRLIASPSFHGKPRFDHTKVVVLEGDAQPKEYFVKVLLIFKFEDESLALIQYLTKQRGAANYRLIEYHQEATYFIPNYRATTPLFFHHTEMSMYQKKKLEREYDLTREIRIIEDFSDSEIESEPDYELFPIRILIVISILMT